MNDVPMALISTYACDPERGSEPGVGFRWLELYLARGWRVVALVHRDRRGGIERTAARLGRAIADGRLRLVVIEPSRWQRVLQELPGCWWFYYRAWQRSVLATARDLIAQGPAPSHVHHLSMNGFREPGDLWRLDVPFVWGPIGGLQDADPRLTASQGWAERLGERVRGALNRWCAARSPRPRAARTRAALVLAANRDAVAWAGQARRCVELLETAVDDPVDPPGIEQRAGVLWVGSDEARKNAEFALQAFALVARACPAPRLTMIGLSADRAAALSDWAWARGVPLERIDFCERLPRAELGQRYAAARVAWFPSYRDTSGNVVLEAMAAGTPVVAFDHQGVASMLAAGAGALIPPGPLAGCLTAWTRATAALIDDDQRWLTVQRAALARLRSRYLWSRTGDAFVAAMAAAGLPVPEPRRLEAAA